MKCPQLSIGANALQPVFEKGFHSSLTSGKNPVFRRAYEYYQEIGKCVRRNISGIESISLAINSYSFVRTLQHTLKLISNVICLLNFIFPMFDSNLNPSFCLSLQPPRTHKLICVSFSSTVKFS